MTKQWWCKRYRRARNPKSHSEIIRPYSASHVFRSCCWDKVCIYEHSLKRGLLTAYSTGGLVALGIGAKSWTIEKCRQNFESLCKDAFQLRAHRDLGFLAYAWNAFNHGKYKTSPLEESLKKAYCSLNWKHEPLFGGISTIPCSPIKAAVVVANIGLGPVVMASYNRSSQENSK